MDRNQKIKSRGFLWTMMALGVFVGGSVFSLEARGALDDRETMFEGLDLTSEQRAQIETIRSEFRSQKQQSRGEMRQKQKEVRALRQSLAEKMKTGASVSELRRDFSQLQKQFDALHDLRKKQTEVRFENSLKIREILTPEQRQNFRGLSERKERRHPRKAYRSGQDQSEGGDSESWDEDEE